MNKKLPNDETTNFVICEYIRHEAGGKLSLLGVYPGYEIIFDANAEELVCPLALYFNFADGSGDFNVKTNIVNPNNEVSVLSEGPVTIFEGKNTTINLQISMIKFKSTGVYKIQLFLDDQGYERTITVSKGDQKNEDG